MWMVFLLILCCGWGIIRCRWLFLPANFQYPRVLMYHMVSYRLPEKHYKDGQKVKNYLRVTPEQFDKQIAWFKNNHFTFLKASDLASDNIPRKSVIITFDDGYEDNFRCAFPILKKYGALASIYLVNNRFEQNWASDRASGKEAVELNDQAMLSHGQVREMLASGLIEIGGHTLNHVRLNCLTEEDQWQEIHHSRIQLQELYGISCDSFAYPFGYFNDESVSLVEKAGYSCALTTEDGTDHFPADNPYCLKRIMISGNDKYWKFIAKIRKGAR